VIDKICFKPLGYDVLNFKTPKAYEYLVNCKDNHKAWQAFQIFIFGMTKEIVHLWASQTEDELSTLNFLKWQSEHTSANIRFVCQLIFTFGLAIYAQRVGDRNNDVLTSDAGRFAFMPFFYSFNHKYYQEIEYRDLANKASYPPPVQAQCNRNLTFGKHKERHQGGDFILEQKIKRQKMIAPKGPVDKFTWQRISRSVDKIENIYEHASALLDISDETHQSTINLEAEILEWRAVLRHSKFLDNSDENHIYDIFGNVLSSDLLNFKENMEAKMYEYWASHLTGKNLQNINLIPLNVLSKDTTDSDSEEYEDDYEY